MSPLRRVAKGSCASPRVSDRWDRSAHERHLISAVQESPNLEARDRHAVALPDRDVSRESRDHGDSTDFARLDIATSLEPTSSEKTGMIGKMALLRSTSNRFNHRSPLHCAGVSHGKHILRR